jgi:hypothetical protein
MKKNIKLITGIAIVMALLISGAQVQADHHGNHNKTNRVDVVKGKPTKTGKTVDWRAKGAEDGKKYFAAMQKIRKAVKSGELTEKEARKKITELRKKNPWVSNRDRGQSRSGRAEIFDKNKDGKLDEKERAEARKAMSDRSKKPENKRKSRRADKKRERPSRKNKK